MSTPNTANSTGFHLKYRPRVLEDIVGHEQAVKTLQGFISTKKYPSAVLFAGPTSVGKTTMARAFAASLSGVPTVEAHSDFLEVNAGDKRTIDDVRNLIGLARNRPMRLPRRFIMLDEAQQLLSNSQAASCLLGPLESPVPSTMWLLTSMELDKFMGTSVGKAMLNRCTLIKLSPHTPADFYKQAVRIVKGEQIRAFTKETLTALSEIPGLEMRTLSNTLQTLSGFLEGREEKLTVDELAELLVKVEARENDVDAAVVRYLISAYYGKVGPALKEILDVDDVFVFLMRAQTLNRAVLFKYTLGDIRHSKVWMTKPAQVMLAQVTKNVADDAAGRKEMLRRMTGVHSAITNARNALTVDVDGLIALTNSLVQ